MIYNILLKFLPRPLAGVALAIWYFLLIFGVWLLWNSGEGDFRYLNL